MEVEPYQVVNLTNNRIPFVFIDMRRGHQIKKDSKALCSALTSATQVRPLGLTKYIQGRVENLSEPIILLHHWDWVAKFYCKKLLKKNRLNVHFVLGGPKGLEKYLLKINTP